MASAPLTVKTNVAALKYLKEIYRVYRALPLLTVNWVKNGGSYLRLDGSRPVLTLSVQDTSLIAALNGQITDLGNRIAALEQIIANAVTSNVVGADGSVRSIVHLGSDAAGANLTTTISVCDGSTPVNIIIVTF